MNSKTKKVLLAAITFQTLFMFACNFPVGITASATDADEEKTIQPANPQAATDEAAIQTNLPVVVLEGGSGYIFSASQISKDDRDVWWNAVQFVPATGCRMVSLGKIGSPAEIQEITFQGEPAPVLVPAIGEGFGLEISRDDQITYAVIRVVKIDADRSIAFDWVYPYLGKVTIIP